MERRIEAVAFAQNVECCCILRATTARDFRLHGVEEISRRNLDQEECEDGDDEQQGDHVEDSSDDEGNHRQSPIP